jgi:hypothetical protein
LTVQFRATVSVFATYKLFTLTSVPLAAALLINEFAEVFEGATLTLLPVIVVRASILGAAMNYLPNKSAIA